MAKFQKGWRMGGLAVVLLTAMGVVVGGFVLLGAVGLGASVRIKATPGRGVIETSPAGEIHNADPRHLDDD